MRALLFVAIATLFVVACSDLIVSSQDPLTTAPTIQMSHVGGDPVTDDLCGGLSPCDAFDYGHAGGTGAPGMCFLPPTVDNHLSDDACSGDFVPGLDGVFQFAWCEVDYSGGDGTAPPTIVNCQPKAEWQDLDEDVGSEHYSSSVRWRRNGQRGYSLKSTDPKI